MAQAGIGRLPIVSPRDPKKLLGIVAHGDLFKPCLRDIDEGAENRGRKNMNASSAKQLESLPDMSAIHDSLAADHDRLDSLLSRAMGNGTVVDVGPYEEFRRGLLKHVGMEEMILLPAVRRLSGKPAVLAEKIRLDHGALTALLVPTPTPAIVAALRTILTEHNLLEERDGGLYAQCERALGAASASVLDALRAARDIPPAEHADGERVIAVVRRALAAAGHERTLP